LQTDFLIIGSGIAGLSCAIKVAEHNTKATVTIITKGDESESNTKYAQGGIAAVLDHFEDSYEQHIQDTRVAGDGLCDEKIVHIVVEEGPKRLKELIEQGARFDTDKKGEYNLGREGGHSQNRILHHKDITGFEIERALLDRIKQILRITILKNHFAIDLVTQHQTKGAEGENTCFGAYVLTPEQNVITVAAKFTLLATGGAGQVYQNTTNPKIATGDGVAMAYRARAEIRDIEFVQYHPTALYNPGDSPSFLISEAVRGAGAVLRNKQGIAFMQQYDERKDLAPRDIVARAIDTELKNSGGDCVYLDCRHMEYGAFVEHFPNNNDKCLSIGIDIRIKMIPVVPAAHYMCGGIAVDDRGRTGIKQLYACGECARTGLHGANRLASNSLLEAIVFAHRIALDVGGELPSVDCNTHIPEWNESGISVNKEKILVTHNVAEVKKLMNDYVGIVRSNERLERATSRHTLLYLENKRLYDRSKVGVELCELRNLITIAYLIIKASCDRTENKGGFYNVDFS
jgi:L-aspartate oxidase